MSFRSHYWSFNYRSIADEDRTKFNVKIGLLVGQYFNVLERMYNLILCFSYQNVERYGAVYNGGCR